MTRTATLALVIAAACAQTARAQSSPSYKITDHAMNAGGHPTSGTVMSSAGPVDYRISLDSIGDGDLRHPVRARLVVKALDWTTSTGRRYACSETFGFGRNSQRISPPRTAAC